VWLWDVRTCFCRNMSVSEPSVKTERLSQTNLIIPLAHVNDR
jgi:hypothetical protein